MVLQRIYFIVQKESRNHFKLVFTCIELQKSVIHFPEIDLNSQTYREQITFVQYTSQLSSIICLGSVGYQPEIALQHQKQLMPKW
jgi:hypothetical protein